MKQETRPDIWDEFECNLKKQKWKLFWDLIGWRFIPLLGFPLVFIALSISRLFGS